ncbi:MAG: transposase, partial [Haliea sp.]
IFRGDSGFCRWKILRWCERHDVRYIVGLAKNSRVKAQAALWLSMAESLYDLTGKKQRLFASIGYGALSWDKPRRVIAKAEHSRLGANPRFVVTNLKQGDQYLYDKLYCARGDTSPATWRTGSRTSNSIYLRVAPPVTAGGQISYGSYCRAWHIPCSKACGAGHSRTLDWSPQAPIPCG